MDVSTSSAGVCMPSQIVSGHSAAETTHLYEWRDYDLHTLQILSHFFGHIFWRILDVLLAVDADQIPFMPLMQKDSSEL